MTKEEFIKEFGINAFEDTTIFAEEYDLFDEKLDELLEAERENAIEEFKKYLLKHKKLVREFKTKHLYESVKIEFIIDTDLEQLDKWNS